MRKRSLALTSVPHLTTLETPTAFFATTLAKFTSPVMSHGVMSRPLPPCQQTLPAPDEGEEDGDTAIEGREGTPLPGGGGCDAPDSKNDNLEVTREVDPPVAVKDPGVATDAAGGKPETAEPIGGSLRDGRSPSSPSTEVSRGGSIVASSSSSSSSPAVEDGAGGAGGESSVGSGYAELPAELPKAEANRLQSWAWHGDAVSSSRLRRRSDRAANVAKELELNLAARALPVEVLDEDDEQLGELASDMELGGYDFDELSDSLAERMVESDEHKSASNVSSLMSSVDDTHDMHDEFALATNETEGKYELEPDFDIPSGPVPEADITPVSMAGLSKSCYKKASLLCLNKEFTGLQKWGIFEVLEGGLPKGEKAVNARWVNSWKSGKDSNVTPPISRLVAKGFIQRGVHLQRDL